MRGRVWAIAALLLSVLLSNSLGAGPARAAGTSGAPSASTRGIIFVHGIHGDARLPGFQALLQPLVEAHPNSFESFAYFDDVANGDTASAQCAAQPVPAYTVVPGFPVDVPPVGSQPYCDSEDDVGLNAVLLDQEITRRVQLWQSDRITLIGNSMGGAIVRAYLAYATETGSPSLAAVDSVLFLQGAQEGSWIGKADQVGNSLLASAIPGVRSAVTSLEQLAVDQFQIDRSRPAIADLTPQSQMYQFDSTAQYLPAIRYANVASDITTRVATKIWWWTVTADLPVRLGDYVMVPGFDDPTRTDWMGGARFLPSAIGRGASSTQWVLPGQATIQRRSAADGTSFWDTSEVLNAPMSHFQLGSQLAQLTVDAAGGQTPLAGALLDWVAALDNTSVVPPMTSASRLPQPARRASPALSVPAPIIPRFGGAARNPVTAVPAASAASDHSAPSMMTFVDHQTGLALVLPAAGITSARQPATFAFQVPGHGVYQGPLGGTQRQLAPNRIVLDYGGPARLGPLIDSAARSATDRLMPVSVHLRAEVDPIHHTAEATLEEGGRRFHLVSRPTTTVREPVLAAFEAASLAADWRALHQLLSADIARAHTESSLATEGAREVSQTGRLLSLRRIAVGDVQAEKDGTQTFRATYEAQRQTPDGSITSGRYVATFLEQGADWRLWFMDATT